MFLMVFEKEVADRLIKSNYRLLHKTIISEKETYVFVNDNKLRFSKEDSKKILRVNRLYF